MRPTALMLALSAVVLALDPSVPLPRLGFQSEMRENAEHWSAVASYAEAFPVALARRLDQKPVTSEAPALLDLESFASRVAKAAKAIQSELA